MHVCINIHSICTLRCFGGEKSHESHDSSLVTSFHTMTKAALNLSLCTSAKSSSCVLAWSTWSGQRISLPPQQLTGPRCRFLLEILSSQIQKETPFCSLSIAHVQKYLILFIFSTAPLFLVRFPQRPCTHCPAQGLN